jgi:hypothetical protein
MLLLVGSAGLAGILVLSGIGLAIWQAADGRTPLTEIVARNVCDEFDVDLEIARRDAEQFVNELSHHGILLVSDRPFDVSSGPVEAA